MKITRLDFKKKNGRTNSNKNPGFINWILLGCQPLGRFYLLKIHLRISFC